MPPAYALKPFVGHTLGACGALEVALTLGCLSQGTLPANPGTEPDAALAVTLNQGVQSARPGPYLFNCFAFGGNNNALIISLEGEGRSEERRVGKEGATEGKEEQWSQI